MENRTVGQRKELVERNAPNVSIRKQCEWLGIDRSSVYYEPRGESNENLHLMRRMDELFQHEPTYGVLRMQDLLAEEGLNYNVKRIRRLLRLMGIEPIYPKKNLSKREQAKYVHPYLLRGLSIDRPNQVWAVDITYIPMRRGFMYLTAIIDVYSRYMVGWQLSNSLEKENQTELLQECLRRYGSPEIINSDQGSQYTTEHWVSFLRHHGIAIIMDGKGRATDNAHIERFFRTLKRDHIHLYPADNGMALYLGIKRFINKYNYRRTNQGIDRRKPGELYLEVA